VKAKATTDLEQAVARELNQPDPSGVTLADILQEQQNDGPATRNDSSSNR
jgi:hypothetical protein